MSLGILNATIDHILNMTIKKGMYLNDHIDLYHTINIPKNIYNNDEKITKRDGKYKYDDDVFSHIDNKKENVRHYLSEKNKNNDNNDNNMEFLLFVREITFWLITKLEEHSHHNHVNNNKDEKYDKEEEYFDAKEKECYYDCVFYDHALSKEKDNKNIKRNMCEEKGKRVDTVIGKKMTRQ